MKQIAFLLLFTSVVFAQKKQVDLLIHNAQVYTVDSSFSKATSFAIKDGLFVGIGESNEMMRKYKADETIDAQNKPVYPGFYDPHSHFVGLSQMLGQCDLVDTKSMDEIIGRLKVYASQNPNKLWIVGRGWDQNDWENKNFPTKEMLDEAFPNRPVFITRIDGHAALVNSRAIAASKISAGSFVDGGMVEVIDGALTGILIDNAMGLVRRVIPQIDEFEKRKLILEAQKLCFSVGLTTVSDAGINRNDIELIDHMQKEKMLKIRDYVMVSLGLFNIEYYLKKGIYKTDHINVRSFKLYADGALGSRGAVLLKPYSDEPAKSGFLLLSASELERNLALIHASGFQANTHCIGDSANRLILNIYGSLLETQNDRRWRIEHAQVVDSKDLVKFKKYSVIPSIQATHATSDMFWADERLGEKRVKTAYAFKDLMKQNGFITNGSDFPVESINPLYGFHAAVARRNAENLPVEGFQMENALSRQEALKAMTIWSAYGNFEDKERGSIEVGKMADFVILDEDIMQIANEKLRNVKVKSTYIGGEKVF